MSTCLQAELIHTVVVTCLWCEAINHINYHNISPLLPHCVYIIHETMCNHAQYFIKGCITRTYSYSECMHVSKHLS